MRDRYAYTLGGLFCTLLVTGIALAVTGPFVLKRGASSSPTVMWRVPLQRVDEEGSFALGAAGAVSFAIPARVLTPGQRYTPCVHVSHGATGHIVFAQYDAVDGAPTQELVLSVPDPHAALHEVTVTALAVTGGTTVTAVTTANASIPGANDTDCTDVDVGCQYELVRSLDQHTMNAGTVNFQSSGERYLVVNEALFQQPDVCGCLEPDLMIGFVTSGTTGTGTLGLLLVALGILVADFMPASLYFLYCHIRSTHKRARKLQQQKECGDVEMVAVPEGGKTTPLGDGTAGVDGTVAAAAAVTGGDLVVTNAEATTSAAAAVRPSLERKEQKHSLLTAVGGDT
eukprot:TRINITY_DN6187_c0_g1_i1.p1 TRINITY_DN6187_c0_g1~~TRINITY_DN6187_c0_g1_i1.p1  ORF type:complete len:342 (-),score=83.58 TRINITY_DN6187_c0_g1_i1:33-1058(-)